MSQARPMLATLMSVGDGWFTVRADSHRLVIHYNTRMVINAVEGQFTVTHAGAAGKSKVGLVVATHTLVIPGTSNWAGVSW
jgi:hypothetical protein